MTQADPPPSSYQPGTLCSSATIEPGYDCTLLGKYTVASFQLQGEGEPVETPPRLGGTWGPGTYKWFKEMGALKTYNFDFRKQTQGSRQ